MSTINPALIPTSSNFGSRIGQLPKAMGAPVSEPSSFDLKDLQDKLLESLASRIPGMKAEDLKQLDANEFTPEKVAGRITDFVRLGLENARQQGKSDAEVEDLYDRAMQGVEKGFREAREILKGLDLLNGKIAADVDETERLTREGLAGLSPSGAADQAGALAGLTGVSMAERYQSSERFDMTLKTRDGDEVTIRFGRDLEVRNRASMVTDDQGNTVKAFDLSRSEASGFQFSVKGDLSTEEIDAIQNLVRDVGQLANEFFRGDVQKAFEQAGSLDIDRSQLSSLQLTMSRNENYSSRAVAAQRYQQTQALDEGRQSSGAPGLRLGQLLRGLRDSIDSQSLSFLEEPKAAAGQLMQGLVEQDSRFQNAAPERQERLREHLGQLLKAIGATLQPAAAEPAPAAPAEPESTEAEQTAETAV